MGSDALKELIDYMELGRSSRGVELWSEYDFGYDEAVEDMLYKIRQLRLKEL